MTAHIDRRDLEDVCQEKSMKRFNSLKVLSTSKYLNEH